MDSSRATELILIRHAPAITGGRLCGRTDVAADLGDGPAVDALRHMLGEPDHVWCSPALRCRQTLNALWPGKVAREDGALWEQHFGEWEGRAHADIPDIGPLSGQALAAHRPPSGESFVDLCRRAGPAIERAADHPGRVAIVAHAGIVRAALALALGDPAAALVFDVSPLSATRLRPLPGKAFGVISVNWTPQ
ncbi:histidine phosphatase family protein [Albidovulum sp.]|uniref:histidine phosphatase family protein n=1 Tax=Albidovulum sp. TaxID=1872424 RepID=UPI001DD42C93|nr:histidine phosphatase family protein [Paracoccaceae bacterium]MCC0045237.1 histidine phosphatase family protein [Defluviimonas sp.]HPE25702.1 histidine phosphatase family protein [Albidovulum sp.]MCB2123983.1 histidine phosphatase family protein [Paracoccaceae bacterium]MCB2132847.1 histidine phosphatase family protein [Paracoccaceae bacterium]